MSSSKKEPHIGVLPDYVMEPIKEPNEDWVDDYICLFKGDNYQPAKKESAVKKTSIKVIKWIGILFVGGVAMALINDFKASSTKRVVAEHLEKAGLVQEPAPNKRNGDTDVVGAINSIPELKYWYENDTPQFQRAIEIDDKLRATGLYEDMPLRTRFLIVLETVKKEKDFATK